MANILCFPYPEEEVDESVRSHNVSIAIGVLGRSTPMEPSIGTPAVSIDYVDHNIFASAHLTLGDAMKHNYWEDKTEELFPFTTKVHTLVPRVVIGSTNDIWYPRTLTGKLKNKSTILKDNSEFIQLIWEMLIKRLDK